MKKVIAILLALVLSLSLIACSTQTAPSPSASAKPSASASTAPSAAASASASAAASASAKPSASASTAAKVGYFEDAKANAAGRKTYNIAFFYLQATALEKAHFSAMQNMQKVMNFTCKDYSANNDPDAFLQNLQTAAQSKYDGYVIDPDVTIFPRIVEVMTELKIPYLFDINSYKDANKSNLVPTVVLDQHKNGVTQTTWFNDNYKKYWTNANPKDIVLMTLEFSTNPDLVERINGVKDKFKELFPGNKIIVGDLAGQTLNEQNAYDKAAAILAANPDVKYWFIDGCVENFGQGAARACESAHKGTDTALIVTSGANVLPGQWDSGYKGNWVASYAVYNYNYIVPCLAGLCALIDKRATWDTLWADQRKPGDKTTQYIAGDQMVTIDTYKSVQADIAKQFGVATA